MAIHKTNPVNPFYVTTDIPDEYFCDREKETADLIGKVKNGPNVVLVADFRIGKTSLLFHLFKSKEIHEAYNTVYVNVFNTKTPEDFINTFKEGLIRSSFSNTERLRIEEITKDYSGIVGLNLHPFSVGAVARSQKTDTIETTLGRIFDFLNGTSRPNLVVFDEFQEIENYQEKIAPVLRSYIQRLNNTRFIYCGSAIYQLTAMFTEYNRPFYKSSAFYGLEKIALETYSEFCKSTFAKYGKQIEPEAVTLVYHLFKGITLDMQLVMKKVFEQTRKGETADVDFVKRCINMLLDEQDMGFATKLYAIDSQIQRNVLFAVVAEGVAGNMTAAAMISRYELISASHVQNAVKKLVDKYNPVIAKIAKGVYVMDNKFFELWLARKMGILEQKYNYAEALFDKEGEVTKRQISFQIKNPRKPSGDRLLIR